MVVPRIRVRSVNEGEARPEGAHVLYWMTAARRTRFNFAFERAVAWAAQLGKPLVVLEALRADYPYASDRLHAFALQGMAANAAALADTPVLYHPYVEPGPDAGKGLVAALAEDACVVVADEWPYLFLPRMLAAAGAQVRVRMEAVDSCGLLPLRASERTFATAYAFRAFLQKQLPPHLAERPLPDPLKKAELPPLRALPRDVVRRWPAASQQLLAARRAALAQLPIDHGVAPVALQGGAAAGAKVLQDFADVRLARYAEGRREPAEDASSGLSPYLHWGHVGAHQVLDALAERESWAPRKLRPSKGGKREGWWGMSAEAEAFLDELVTWRELGFQTARGPGDPTRYDTLPEWALATLEEHAADPREHLYTKARFEAADTHDPLWNAAQEQLLCDGRIHNYLRMLWGKKVLEWSASPREALAILFELNDRYAVDGRDPNSVSGITWVLGRYDRPWPERPIYGKVRSMTSDSTRRKLDADAYIARWSGCEPCG
jgi:deoxyribodipyrimidine photo-lyase